MFSNWLLARPRSTKKPQRSFRLGVERLEDRDCPSAPGGLHVTLNADVLAGHKAQLSGTVTGGDVSGITVNFTGAANGSAMTDANGAFSFTTSSASLGTVYASGDDTDTASAILMVGSPCLSPLSITYGAQRTITVTGTYIGIDPGGETVVLSGVAQGCVTTDSAGAFSITATASALGEVDATSWDLWGQMSNTAEETLVSAPPVISNFSASTLGGNVWIFTGNVTDESPAGLIINFSGVLGYLDGQTVQVNSDGSFTLSITLPADAWGTAVATTTDWWGQTSAEAWAVL
jgi:hypothetical protein